MENSAAIENEAIGGGIFSATNSSDRLTTIRNIHEARDGEGNTDQATVTTTVGPARG